MVTTGGVDTTTDATRVAARTGHPVPEEILLLEGRVGDLLDRPLLSLDAAAARESLVALARTRARLDALTLVVAAQADRVDVAATSGAASTGAWWAHATQQVRPAALGQVKLGRALEDRWHRVGAAAAAGRANLEQVRVMVHALEDLPEDLDRESVEKAEVHLVELAEAHDAKALRMLGRAILETLAPDVAEDHERRRLDAEEARARQRMRLTLSRDGHGSVHGRFCVPEAHGAVFEKALWALASPRHRAAVESELRRSQVDQGDQGGVGEGGVGEEPHTFVGRPAPYKLGAAFCELIESFDAGELPQAGGTDATVLVTIDFEKLVSGAGTATLDTGEKVTATTVRRVACEAGLIPVVLTGESQPLDVGRERRFHTRAMRHAATVRDQGCTAEGCDWPPAMCHLHHEHPWSQGGGTSLHESRLLCAHHHRRIHDPEYEATRLPEGKVRFHRRT